jgi:GDPmannose 4,6-dehydratase
MSKRALILGVGGQDGAYLSKLLLDKGYQVIGTSRDAGLSPFSGLNRLGILGKVLTTSTVLTDFRSVLGTIRKYQPDEIYNLAGQSSVGLSFDQPVETMESVVLGTLNVLEAMRFEGGDIRFYNAGSSECFGDTGELAATEATPFRPRSPYAVAKASAHYLVANYREAYKLFACTGVLFNHESPLRPERFVTQKIVSTAARIAAGSEERLRLGNIQITRDWGWAPEFVEAMWRMLQQPEADDYIIATGRSESLSYFVEQVFKQHGLEWKMHTEIDGSLLRPSDIQISRGNPGKAERKLGWTPSRDIDGVIADMCAHARGEASRTIGAG